MTQTNPITQTNQITQRYHDSLLCRTSSQSRWIQIGCSQRGQTRSRYPQKGKEILWNDQDQNGYQDDQSDTTTIKKK